jgi:hypothetical protein
MEFLSGKLRVGGAACGTVSSRRLLLSSLLWLPFSPVVLPGPSEFREPEADGCLQTKHGSIAALLTLVLGFTSLGAEEEFALHSM